MTHAQRLREIAVWHDRQAAAWERTCNASPDAFSRDLMLFHREAAAFLRAAADWCERVPHEHHCASHGTVMVGGISMDVNVPPNAREVSLPCNCIKSEPAP